MLDDHTGRGVEFLHAFQCRIGIGDVVERQLLALQLGGGGNRGFVDVVFHVEGGALVAVFAVAQILLLGELVVDGAREGRIFAGFVVGRHHGAEVVGNHAVVLGGVLEGRDSQVETGGLGQAVVAGIHFAQQAVVIAGVHHDGHVVMVLGGGTNHGRATDVDVFDGIFEGATGFGHGIGEGIEVNHHHVDGLDGMLGHDGIVLTATAENAAVYLGVQGLDPAIHHFREAGVVGHFGDRQALFGQQAGGATGRQQFYAAGVQALSEGDDAVFVGHTQQSTANGSSSFHGFSFL